MLDHRNPFERTRSRCTAMCGIVVAAALILTSTAVVTSAASQALAAPGAAGHAADGTVTSAHLPSVALFDPVVRAPITPKPKPKCDLIPRFKKTVCPPTNPLALKAPIIKLPIIKPPIIKRIGPPAIHPPVA